MSLFTTCYCNYNEPALIESLVKVLNHNGVNTEFLQREHCCGMPKLELGDLKSVTKLKELNIPIIAVGRIELDVAEKGLKNNEFDFLAMEERY